jgi:protein gp37
MCTRISPGCERCYAETLNLRWGTKLGYTATGNAQSRWIFVDQELKAIQRLKTPSRIFVGDMTDLFHERVSDAWLDAIVDTMAACPQHTFQVLTKRPERLQAYGATRPLPPWVHVGISAEDQPRLETRWPWLAGTSVMVRWISYEPMLGPLDLASAMARAGRREAPGWVVAGGESGARYRPMDLSWLEAIARQCEVMAIPLFVKQDHGARQGQQGRIPDGLWARKTFPSGPGSGSPE